MRVDAIIVGDRFRTDLGDVAELARSIERSGLLHPVVVTTDGTLVAGGRRLAAVRSLGWTDVEVNVVSNLTDATSLLIAERDENTCRLDMTPSEKVALGRALEEVAKPEAEQRKRDGGSIGGSGGYGQGSVKVTEPSVRDRVASAVGMSGPTYARAKAVVRAAESGEPGADFAREEMDATGNVSGPYNAVVDARKEREEPTGRNAQVAHKHLRKLRDVAATLDGMARGIDAIDIEQAAAVATPDDLSEIAGWLGRSLTTLRTFANETKRRSDAV